MSLCSSLSLGLFLIRLFKPHPAFSVGLLELSYDCEIVWCENTLIFTFFTQAPSISGNIAWSFLFDCARCHFSLSFTAVRLKPVSSFPLHYRWLENNELPRDDNKSRESFIWLFHASPFLSLPQSRRSALFVQWRIFRAFFLPHLRMIAK